MSVTTAYSTNPDPTAAIAEIHAALSATAPALVLAFASPAMAPDTVASGLAHAFPGARIAGCTSAGEIVSGHMLRDRSWRWPSIQRICRTSTSRSFVA